MCAEAAITVGNGYGNCSREDGVGNADGMSAPKGTVR